MISSLALFFNISRTIRYVSHRNFSHGVTTALSVRSFDCSPDTVDNNIDSGVSIASKSSTFVPVAEGSRVDCISAAFSCASVTFCSASSIKRLRTSYKARQQVARCCLSTDGLTSIVPTFVFCAVFLYWYKPSFASLPFLRSTQSSTNSIITGSKEEIGLLRDLLEVTCS